MTTKTEARRGGSLLVIWWARMPRGAEELYNILADTRDDELVALMTAVGGPSGRIAWAEYGRRKWGVPYGIEVGQAVPYMLRDCGGIWS